MSPIPMAAHFSPIAHEGVVMRPEQRRLRALYDGNFDFVGRLVRNLGVEDGDVDDVLQQTFSVAMRRIDDIAAGAEQAFLVQTAVRIVAHLRRTWARRREVITDDLSDLVDGAPTPEDLSDRRRARAVLDRILDTMDMDLRTPFVLFEIEEMTMAEIASVLTIPTGTVASRLRRAREDFEKHMRRLTGGSPPRSGT